jgi:hypothetical protein
VSVDTVVADVRSDSSRTRINADHNVIRYDLRRIEVDPGRFVQDYTLRAYLKPGAGVDADTGAAVAARATAAVDDLLNPGFRLPGGDQFHVTLEFTDHPSHAHTTIEVGGSVTDQTHWSPAAGAGVLAHETLHYLGVPDEYRDPDRVLLRHDANSGVHSGDGGLMGRDVLGEGPGLRPRHLWMVERTARSQVAVPDTRLGDHQGPHTHSTARPHTPNTDTPAPNTRRAPTAESQGADVQSSSGVGRSAGPSMAGRVRSSGQPQPGEGAGGVEDVRVHDGDGWNGGPVARVATGDDGGDVIAADVVTLATGRPAGGGSGPLVNVATTAPGRAPSTSSPPRPPEHAHDSNYAGDSNRPKFQRDAERHPNPRTATNELTDKADSAASNDAQRAVLGDVSVLPMPTGLRELFDGLGDRFKRLGSRRPRRINPEMDAIQSWLSEINRDRSRPHRAAREENCGQTALAVFDRLAGRDSFQRAGLDSMTADGMAAAIGRPFVQSDPDRIAEALIRSGRGSHTVVHVVRGMVGDDPATATSAHTFNAYYDGSTVYTLDGQVGRIENWPPNMNMGKEKVTAWLVHAPEEQVKPGPSGELAWILPGSRNGIGLSASPPTTEFGNKGFGEAPSSRNHVVAGDGVGRELDAGDHELLARAVGNEFGPPEGSRDRAPVTERPGGSSTLESGRDSKVEGAAAPPQTTATDVPEARSNPGAHQLGQSFLDLPTESVDDDETRSQPGISTGTDSHPAGVSDPTSGSPYAPLHLPFDRHVKSLAGRLDPQIETFVANVVNAAEARYRAGQGGLALRAEGGGNGGVFSRGADTVGKSRAKAVLDVMRPQIESSLQGRGVPTDFVTFSDPASRGRAFAEGDVSGWDEHLRDEHLRRVVEVRIENRPHVDTAPAPRDRGRTDPSANPLHPGDVRDAHGRLVPIPRVALPGTTVPQPPMFRADRPSAQLDSKVDVAKIVVGQENPNGVVYFRADDNLLFRDDSRDPSQVFLDGFAPRRRAANMNLSDMDDDGNSAFVSTTRHPNANPRWTSLRKSRVFRYVIDAPGGIDVDHTLGEMDGGRRRMVVAFAGGVRGENIVGAQEVSGGPSPMDRGSRAATDLVLGDFIPNPRYRPDAPNVPSEVEEVSRLLERHGIVHTRDDVLRKYAELTPQDHERSAGYRRLRLYQQFLTAPSNAPVGGAPSAGDPVRDRQRPPRSESSSAGQHVAPAPTAMDPSAASVLPETVPDLNSSSNADGTMAMPSSPARLPADPDATGRQATEGPAVGDRDGSGVLSETGSQQLPVLDSGSRRNDLTSVPEDPDLQVLTAKDKGKGREGAATDRKELLKKYAEASIAYQSALSNPDPAQQGRRGETRARLAVALSDLTRSEDPDASAPSEVVVATREPAPPEPPKPPKPPEPPHTEPQLPKRMGSNLVLGGADVLEQFDSGNAAVTYFENVVRRVAGDQIWRLNQDRIRALFSDLGLRPTVPGLLRGGRMVAHIVYLGRDLQGAEQNLTLELKLRGKSERLSFTDEVKEYEVDNAANPGIVIGSLSDGRNTALFGVQANVTIPNFVATVGTIGTWSHESALREQRTDRQITSAQTAEPAHRFAGDIEAELFYWTNSGLTSAAPPTTVNFHTVVVVPSRDVNDRLEPTPTGGDPPKVRRTHALSASDAVTNLWLIPDDDPAGGPSSRTIPDLLDSESMSEALARAYGQEAAQARVDISRWLTVELLQANLHGMTNKQPLVLDFDHVDGGWVEVHAFMEPLGTPNDPSSGNRPDHAAGPSARLLHPTGVTAKTEFHFGTETDTTEVRQKAVTWSGQLPTARVRGQGDAAPTVEGGADATSTLGVSHEESHSRQFRQRNTLKLAVPGQGLHGQVRLRFEMHSRREVPPTNQQTRFKGAATVETRGRFDVLMEKSETVATESYQAKTVWAPPERIWGRGPADQHNAIAKSPWWRPGTGGRSTVGIGNPAGPTVNRGGDRMAEPRGLGGMDRVNNLDLSGFRGMLDSMGRRAVGDDWEAVRPRAEATGHLNRLRGSLHGMSQQSPFMVHMESSGLGPSTKVMFTADFEQLTYRRVINALASPSAEITEGLTITNTENRQPSLQGALGGRFGQVAGAPVLVDLIAGVNRTVRDGDRSRNQQRVAVATKFEQTLAIFDGWVRLDGTMVGSKATVHESGLFPIEIAIPLTELQGSRVHDSPLPPTFTRAFPMGFVDEPRSTPPPDRFPVPLPPGITRNAKAYTNVPPRSEGWTVRGVRKVFGHPAPSVGAAIYVPETPAVDNAPTGPTAVVEGTAPPLTSDVPRPTLKWTARTREQSPPVPPPHALGGAWHPSDVLLGIDPAVDLMEAIREDLGPVLGKRLDDAMVAVAAQFGPNVLVARLTHQSGELWSLDIAVPGGTITVKVRPFREESYEYVGRSGKFETDLSLESQSAVSHVHDRVDRTVGGVRLQIPFGHGSLTLQGTRSATFAHRRDGLSPADQGAAQLTDASGLNITGESDHRIPLRVRTTQPHNLFRQQIRFDISYETHFGATLLTKVPDRPEPVRVSGVFSYPQHEPTRLDTSRLTRPLTFDQVVLKVTPPEGIAWNGKSEGLLASHVLDEMQDTGLAVFGEAWSKVRAELVPHVKTMAVQRDLGRYSRGGTTTIDLKSVRGAKVVIGAGVDFMYEAKTGATSEFYTGGLHQLTAGRSQISARSGQVYAQVQGDLLPTGPAVNVSVLGRVDGGFGTESLNTRTESSSTGWFSRRKLPALVHVGTATISARMMRPASVRGSSNARAEGTGDAKVEFIVGQSPNDRQDLPRYVPLEPLSRGSIVRAITDVPGFVNETWKRVSATSTRLNDGRVEAQFRTAFTDVRLQRSLRVMFDRDAELWRHKALVSLKGRAELLESYLIADEGNGHAYVTNESGQSRIHQRTGAFDVGGRMLAGPHLRLPAFQGTLLAGGGANHRERRGDSFAQTTTVAANAKFNHGFVAFYVTVRIIMTLRDGKHQRTLPGVDLHATILVPRDAIIVADDHAHPAPAPVEDAPRPSPSADGDGGSVGDVPRPSGVTQAPPAQKAEASDLPAEAEASRMNLRGSSRFGRAPVGLSASSNHTPTPVDVGSPVEGPVSVTPHQETAADDSDDIGDLYEAEGELFAHKGIAADAVTHDRADSPVLSTIESDSSPDEPDSGVLTEGGALGDSQAHVPVSVNDQLKTKPISAPAVLPRPRASGAEAGRSTVAPAAATASIQTADTAGLPVARRMGQGARPADTITAADLNDRFGEAVALKNVKQSERDRDDAVRLNPLWYR